MEDFENFTHTENGITHTVYKKGKGPGIIIMHELPGMILECVEFARKISDAGYTVYLPLFFGEPGEKNTIPSLAFATAKYFAELCVSKEFAIFSAGKTSPIVDWLKGLCRLAHKECGYGGVGAIGMCLTGGFAIPMLVEPSLMAPVLSQPSLPIGAAGEAKKSLGCSDADFQKACLRAKTEKIPVLGFKFTHDILAANEKFDNLKSELGDLFIENRIDSGPNNPDRYPLYAHSVFTVNYNTGESSPTGLAFRQLLDFFQERLKK